MSSAKFRNSSETFPEFVNRALDAFQSYDLEEVVPILGDLDEILFRNLDFWKSDKSTGMGVILIAETKTENRFERPVFNNCCSNDKR